MKVSKMHFAEELARRGNQVFFVNPPRKRTDGRLCGVESLHANKNISLIHVKEHPLRILLREKCFFLYKILEGRYIRGIKKVTGAVDEVWNFNPQFIMQTRRFGAHKTLLMMYDLFGVKSIHNAAEDSDAIVSVAQRILDSFNDVDKPKYLIQHGLAPAFEAQAKMKSEPKAKSGKVKIGYFGNLFHPGIARESFMKIISDHPKIEFHVWGADGFTNNNLSTDEAGEEITSFIAFLKACENVFFHGIKPPEILAKEIKVIDGFLALYSRGSNLNAHKILEYLSTGKAVFATAIEQYKGTGLLVQDDDGIVDFPTFFDDEIKRLQWHNSTENQQRRITYALDNTYAKQVDRIFAWKENIRASFALHSG